MYSEKTPTLPPEHPHDGHRKHEGRETDSPRSAREINVKKEIHVFHDSWGIIVQHLTLTFLLQIQKVPPLLQIPTLPVLLQIQALSLFLQIQKLSLFPQALISPLLLQIQVLQ